MSRPSRPKFDLETTVTVTELATIFDVSGQAVRDWGRQGRIPCAGDDGRVSLVAAIRAFKEYDQFALRARSPAGIKDELMREQCRKLRLENDQKEGLLVDMELVNELAKQWAGAVVSEMANWSARITRDANVRVIIDREVAASLTRIRKTVETGLLELLGPEDENETAEVGGLEGPTR